MGKNIYTFGMVVIHDKLEVIDWHGEMCIDYERLGEIQNSDQVCVSTHINTRKTEHWRRG